MYRLLKAAAAIGLATAIPAASAQVSSWYGRYVWEESLGRIGGSSPAEGVASFVTYSLSLRAGNGSTGCMLTAQGFQTDRRIQCTATPQGTGLIVKFYKSASPAGDGYRIGTALFTLSRTSAGIVTRLQALGPASDASPRSGRLFRRIG
jgi:uncharacterized protein DUF5991